MARICSCYQTLVIDCDPQANLTASWVDSDIYNVTLSHVLIEPEARAGIKLEPRALDDAIVESPLTNLDLVPGGYSPGKTRVLLVESGDFCLIPVSFASQ
jgi:cellulose biosynthesis protein BcsQ